MLTIYKCGIDAPAGQYDRDITDVSIRVFSRIIPGLIRTIASALLQHWYVDFVRF